MATEGATAGRDETLVDLLGADVVACQEVRVKNNRARSIRKRWSKEETFMEWGHTTKQLRQRGTHDVYLQAEAVSLLAIAARRLPIRRRKLQMDMDLEATGRIMEVVIVTWSMPILILNSYGNVDDKAAATALVAEAMQRARAARGTLGVLMVGDINLEPDETPIFQTMRAAGWADAAELRRRRDGKPPKPTTDAGRRIDMMWLSPNLVEHFGCFEVLNDRLFPCGVQYGTGGYGPLPQVPGRVVSLLPAPYLGGETPWRHAEGVCPVIWMDGSRHCQDGVGENGSSGPVQVQRPRYFTQVSAGRPVQACA